MWTYRWGLATGGQVSAAGPGRRVVPLRRVVGVKLGRFRCSRFRNEFLQFNRGLVRPLLHLWQENEVVLGFYFYRGA